MKYCELEFLKYFEGLQLVRLGEATTQYLVTHPYRCVLIKSTAYQTQANDMNLS